jgi:hypothetical protein
MIPEAYDKIRKYLAFSYIQRKGHYFTPDERFIAAGEANPYIDFVVNKLKVPKELLFSSRAIYN